MRKKLIRFLVVVFVGVSLVMTLSSCMRKEPLQPGWKSDKGNQFSVSEGVPMFNEVKISENLVYDANTKIVYIYYSAYGGFCPYISENGRFCRFNSETKTVEEIVPEDTIGD
jgi:hypothetical protein